MKPNRFIEKTVRAQLFIERKAPVMVTLERVTKAEEELPPGVLMAVKGKGANAGVPTANENLYTRDRWEEMIVGAEPMLAESSLFGLADHPEPGKSPSVREICLLFTSFGLNRQTGEVRFEAFVPKTAAGKDVAALAEAGAKVGISSRVHGTAKRVTITDQHPDFDLCKEWEGREVNELEAGTILKGFDVVIDPAVSDAGITDHHEEVEMDKVKEMLQALGKAELDEESVKTLIELPAVKAQIDAAIEAATGKTKAELEAQFGEAVDKKVADYLKSEEFMAHVAEKFELKDKPAVQEAKCPDCGKSAPKGAKYCPNCATRMDEAKPVTQDEKDEKIAQLEAELADQKKKNDEQENRIAALEKKDEDEATEKDRKEAINKALEGKPTHIANTIRADLESTQLKPEDIGPVVEKKAAALIAFQEAVGGADPVKSKTGNDPADADKDKTKRVTEESKARKAQASRASDICG